VKQKQKQTVAELHTARLLKLAYILAAQVDGDGHRGTMFNMAVWGYHDGRHRPQVKDNFCGTAACALGHAGMDKQFRADGLKLSFRKSGDVYEGEVRFEGLGLEGVEAGAEFFGLTQDESRNLFGNSGSSKATVIEMLCRYAQHREEVSL